MAEISPIKTPTTEELTERLPAQFRPAFLAELKKRVAAGKKVRVYSDGCFDLFHYAHARQLEQVKKILENVELVVGICSDEDITKNKGTIVMNNAERCESLRHCKWVDKIIFPAPWVPTLQFLNDHNIDFIAHDALPYSTADSEDCYEPMKRAGRFLATLRTPGVSTTELLIRILKDREDYYERNLKKGYSRNSMNLNYFEYFYIQARGVFHNVQRCLKKSSRHD